MNARIGKWFSKRSPRTQLIIQFALYDIVVVSNLALAWVIYMTFRDLYPHSSGWTAFGMWWLVLIASEKIIGNIARVTIKAFGVIRAHRLASGFRHAAHRAMQRAQ